MYRGKFDLSIWFTNTDSHGERKNKKNYRRIILVKSHKILQSGLANLTEEQCMASSVKALEANDKYPRNKN